ncbi:unnamed protein product, partial [Prunus brigantina]
ATKDHLQNIKIKHGFFKKKKEEKGRKNRKIGEEISLTKHKTTTDHEINRGIIVRTLPKCFLYETVEI